MPARTDLTSVRVPAIGPRNAKIAIVGEGPGRQEVEAGEPFIGASGKDLDKYLYAAGLDRKDIFITNVTKFYPDTEDDDKDSFFFHTTGSKKNPTRTPTKAYMDGIIELVQELREVQPNVVVPLGNYALWALTQQTGIMKYRGSILESTLIPGLKVIPTIHPAWYIRAFVSRPKLLANWDFQRVAAQSKFPEICRKPRNFIVNPTPEQIEEAIERYTDPSLDHITADTEWYSPDRLAYIGFTANDTDAICISPDSMLAFRAYKAILGSPIPKVWQNAMFDAVALWRLGIEVKNVAHDTMIQWGFCWGNILKEGAMKRTNGLDMICSVLTEEPYYKEDVEFVGQDDRGQIYCCTDCVVEDEAFVKLRDEEIPLTGVDRGYNITMSVMNTFIGAAQRGIRVDIEKLDRMSAEYIETADELEDELAEVYGKKINCRSWQQVQPFVYDFLGLGKRFTARSTDQLVLMDIAATLDAEKGNAETIEYLKKIIRIRQNRNIVSRYINRGIVDTLDNRARTFWNLNGTKNGRLSTSNPWWNGLAFQTVPEDARELFIADEGHVFIGWDYAQAEARVVAVKTNNYDLLQDMENGVDIHLKMAAALPFGLTYDEHYAAMRAVVAEGKSKDEYAPRFLAKRTRHASNYIQSAFGLKAQINKDFIETGIGIDTATAKLLADGFLIAEPGLEAWWKTVLETMRNVGYIDNCFGRRRNFYGRITWQDHEHKDGVAYEPQSTIADLDTLAIRDIDQEEWTQVLLHTHDGGLIQVPEYLKDDGIELVRRCALREIYPDNQALTVPVDVKVGYDWKNLAEVR